MPKAEKKSRQSSAKSGWNACGPAPIMLASWPGKGNVGILAVDYIRRYLNAKPYAAIDMSPFMPPRSVSVENGLTYCDKNRYGMIYCRRDPDVLILESSVSLEGCDRASFAKDILKIARKFSASTVFSVTGHAQLTTHTLPSRVIGAATAKSILSMLQVHGVEPMVTGDIGGLNAALLWTAASMDVEAACLLGTIPRYARWVSYPRASIAIVQTFSKILNVSIELSELEEQAQVADVILDILEEQMEEKTTKQSDVMEELTGDEYGEAPQWVTEKIEALFETVRKDRNCASKLKQELDRWNLYDSYEDRFLDLFSTHGQ